MTYYDLYYLGPGRSLIFISETFLPSLTSLNFFVCIFERSKQNLHFSKMIDKPHNIYKYFKRFLKIYELKTSAFKLKNPPTFDFYTPSFSFFVSI